MRVVSFVGIESSMVGQLVSFWQSQPLGLLGNCVTYGSESSIAEWKKQNDCVIVFLTELNQLVEVTCPSYAGDIVPSSNIIPNFPT